MITAARLLGPAIALTLVLPAAADTESGEGDGRWRILLQQQLKAEKNCDLNEILKYSELPLGDEMAIDGRSSCIDGREFDFSRKRPHQKFEIKLCEPTVC